MVASVKETARLLMMEKLGDPESISLITESAEALGMEASHSAKSVQVRQATHNQPLRSNPDAA